MALSISLISRVSDTLRSSLGLATFGSSVAAASASRRSRSWPVGSKFSNSSTPSASTATPEKALEPIVPPPPCRRRLGRPALPAAAEAGANLSGWIRRKDEGPHERERAHRHSAQGRKHGTKARHGDLGKIERLHNLSEESAQTERAPALLILVACSGGSKKTLVSPEFLQGSQGEGWRLVGCRMLDAGCSILDAGWWMRDARCLMRIGRVKVAGSAMAGNGFG